MKPPVLGLLIVAVFFSVAAGGVAMGDDSSIQGMGGNLTMMRPPHPTISMLNEVVRIDHLPAGHVNAVFTFRNEGAACTATIGFPAYAGGDGSNTNLANFRSWVDGRPIAVRRVAGKSSNDDEGSTGWYIKRVHFEKGQTHIITDDYDGGLGESNGVRMFFYVLATGASWHRPIGHGIIIIDASGITRWGRPTLSPNRFAWQGSTATWQFRNLRPNQHDDVRIEWVTCFTDITVNGHKLEECGGLGENLFSQRRGREIWLPADLAADWLGAKMTRLTKGNYRITLGSRWVDFRTWSTELTPSAGRKVRLPYAVDIETVPRNSEAAKIVDGYGGSDGGYHMIGLVGLIRALGGDAHFDKDNISLIATLPRSEPPKN